jgi:hypothetical protein
MPILSPSPSLAIFPQIKLGEGEGTKLGEGKRDLKVGEGENNPEKKLGILRSGKVCGASESPKTPLTNSERLGTWESLTRGQCYKCFVRNLRVFEISEIVCLWQAFSA